MTNIKIYGIMSKTFGEEIDLKVGSINHLFDAIDANRPGFIQKINKLAKLGFHYALIIDGKRVKDFKRPSVVKNPKKIEIVPLIAGNGLVAGIVAGVVSVVSTVAAAVGAVFGAIGAGLGALGAAIASGGALANFALFVAGTALSMLLAPSPDFPDAVQQKVSTAGLEMSFAFANRSNVASQGSPVPIGYGRLKLGSQVIQASLKAFPQNVLPQEAMVRNPYNSAGDIAQTDTVTEVT